MGNHSPQSKITNNTKLTHLASCSATANQSSPKKTVSSNRHGLLSNAKYTIIGGGSLSATYRNYSKVKNTRSSPETPSKISSFCQIIMSMWRLDTAAPIEWSICYTKWSKIHQCVTLNLEASIINPTPKAKFGSCCTYSQKLALIFIIIINSSETCVQKTYSLRETINLLELRLNILGYARKV